MEEGGGDVRNHANRGSVHSPHATSLASVPRACVCVCVSMCVILCVSVSVSVSVCVCVYLEPVPSRKYGGVCVFSSLVHVRACVYMCDGVCVCVFVCLCMSLCSV